MGKNSPESNRDPKSKSIFSLWQTHRQSWWNKCLTSLSILQPGCFGLVEPTWPALGAEQPGRVEIEDKWNIPCAATYLHCHN